MGEMICLFVDTSLNTHLVLGLQEEDNLCILKDKIRNVHLECFPYHGGITISSFKVKRNGLYYYLSDSITSGFYHFMNKTNGHIFVDVVSDEERAKQTKKRKSLKQPSTNPNHSALKDLCEPIDLSKSETKVNEIGVKGNDEKDAGESKSMKPKKTKNLK